MRRLILALLCGLMSGCATAPAAVQGCVCQGSAALGEIASGQLMTCAPGVAAWETEWYRDCAEACR